MFLHGLQRNTRVLQLVIETSAAMPVAAVLTDRFRGLDASIRNVGIVLCGGNVDIDKLPW